MRTIKAELIGGRFCGLVAYANNYSVTVDGVEYKFFEWTGQGRAKFLYSQIPVERWK